MSITHYNPEDSQDRRALAVALVRMLTQEARFSLSDNHGGEDIYEFPIPQIEGVRIRVYSSIVNGMCRGNGEDAIRVSVMYKRKSGENVFLMSETRINRTGSIASIVQRTLDRMRSSYKNLRENGKRCPACRAPMFTSLKKNDVCAELCWTKK